MLGHQEYCIAHPLDLASILTIKSNLETILVSEKSDPKCLFSLVISQFFLHIR